MEIGEQDLLSSGLGAPGNNLTRTLSGSFFVYVPSVCFEYAVLNWMALRVGASYVGMAAPSWKVDGNLRSAERAVGRERQGFHGQCGASGGDVLTPDFPSRPSRCWVNWVSFQGANSPLHFPL